MTRDTATTTPPRYDGAPRPITVKEAVSIAHDEYPEPSRCDREWSVRSRGADGGYHARAWHANYTAAKEDLQARRAAFVDRILAGECEHTIFYDSARGAYYSG